MALQSNIPALRRGLPRAVTEAIEAAALDVRAVAADEVPVDTSALKRTIRVEGDGEGLTPERVVVAGDPTALRPTTGEPVIYAADVEYGTPLSRAQPYMTPAARAVDPAIEMATRVADLARRSALS